MSGERGQIRIQTMAWLGLMALTLLGLALGEWFHSLPWLPLLVGAVIWLKGTLVARHFIGTRAAHPFIARLLQVFIALAPLTLVLISLLPRR